MGERQTTDLVVSALVMALARRDPDGDLVHHADRGCQYTSLEFTNRLAAWGIDASYGSTGDCFDCEITGGVGGSGLTLATTGRHVPLR
jgi:transposase InsO family protein